VMSDALTVMQRDRIAELALKSRLPTILPLREYVVAGGLMAYGENIRDFFRRAAFYVDKMMDTHDVSVLWDQRRLDADRQSDRWPISDS
jgi:hypothetical protein